MKHPERRYEVSSKMSEEDYARFEGFMARYNIDIGDAVKKARTDGTTIWYYEVTPDFWKLLLRTPFARGIKEKEIYVDNALKKVRCSNMGYNVVLGSEMRVVFDGVDGKYYSDDEL